MVVLDFGFVCDELALHRVCSNWFSTQYIIVSTFGTYYILSGMDGNIILYLVCTYIKYYIQVAEVHIYS